MGVVCAEPVSRDEWGGSAERRWAGGNAPAIVQVQVMQQAPLAVVTDNLGASCVQAQVVQRVLLVVGSNDLIIPSNAEGPRLKSALPRCRLQVLQGRSHALMQVSRRAACASCAALGRCCKVGARYTQLCLLNKGSLPTGAHHAVVAAALAGPCKT